MIAIQPELATKLGRLDEMLRTVGSALVAFSGGVDSSLLLRVAHDALGDHLTALTSVSPTNPEEDTARSAICGRAADTRLWVSYGVASGWPLQVRVERAGSKIDFRHRKSATSLT